VQAHREASSHSVLTSGDINEFNHYPPAVSSVTFPQARNLVIARQPSDIRLVGRNPSHSSRLNKYLRHADADAKKIRRTIRSVLTSGR
jgi:hypothetical protein